MITRVLIVTDAWRPQINGVVRSLEQIVKILEQRGFEVLVVQPSLFKTFRLPIYHDIRFPINPFFKLGPIIRNFKPDVVHVATEGILGNLARAYCIRHKIPFSTAYHTRFPEYAKTRFKVPLAIGYAYVRWFHAPSKNVMVSSPVLRNELSEYGFKNIANWSLGVDTEMFTPEKRDGKLDYRYALYVGRLAVEKNVEAFLNVNLNMIDNNLKRVIVGDGDDFERLRKKYSDTIFVGSKEGNELARYYANADVFCFPSRTETFGLVIIEALASGVPVAAYSVPQIEAIITRDVGYTSDSLLKSIYYALEFRNPTACRQYVVKNFSWDASVDQFIQHM